MPESTLESVPVTTPQSELNITETIVDDGSHIESKPKSKSRNQRAKRPRITVVPTRKKAIRFPPAWKTDLRARSIPNVIVRPKAKTRFPLHWAAKLRANVRNRAIYELPSQLPDQPTACDVNTKRIVEAILFAANKPMTIKQIQQAFPELEQPDTLEIQLALEAIAQDYLTRPIALKQLASGYRFQLREGMAPWVTRLFEEKPPRYSRALLETLSIIAYRQPVTRGEIEDIRGVGGSSGIIHTLLDREWIRVIAHKEVPGRPALYGTTKQFLDYFNLISLEELPALEEIADLDFSNEQTQQEHRERPQAQASKSDVAPPDGAAQESATIEESNSESSLENRTLH